jgi:alpha-1,2-mannosyltransferase
MRKIGLAIVNAVVLAWFLAPPGPWFDKIRMDLDVYRLGAGVWLAGGDLYGRLPPTIIPSHLPFTYPPIAAVLFTPFTLVPYVVASAVLTLLSIAVLALVVVVVLRSLDVRPTYVLVAAVLPVALLLEPVRVTLYFGQVNILLMALVVMDCLVRTPRWPRGVLVGLAAAVKLTPAAFVLFFLLRGDRRAAVTAAVSFAGITVVGFLLNPKGSVTYWTNTVFNANRIGRVTQESNQSINGLLSRVGIERGLLWLILACGVVALGAVAVRRAVHPVDALGLNAFVVLLSSPISWSHHWVWCVPVLLAAGVTAWRTRAWPLAMAGTVLFLLSPHWWWDADDGWTPLTLTVGNAYVWCAVGVLVWRGGANVRSASSAQPTVSSVGRA